MGAGHAKEFGPASRTVLAKSVNLTGQNDVAYFAAGCFWSVEMSFQRIPGVVSTEVGYTQGQKLNPTYEQVCAGTTGHTEAVKVVYDKSALKYDELLTVFWDILDPTTLNRQGGDSGTQYRSGIYYTSEEQKKALAASIIKEQTKYTSPIVTEVKEAATWYPAEGYHQQYLQKGGQCAGKGDLTPIRCYG
mmetsp:Transcript_20382/g.19697  ORF Transcript_20382/g.19697 Transcript_20382/m.19697 type:complete len:190 (-) Transcript_20382:181-750(-)|eukprot:CAMPEP_0119033134 /NCGR_PEP_ID=MMETSP1177-20130426/133_1 /TAXON_ID=2985 /ORGANISM="Ochromonas sp, Strain CCMP1899" /LENGTH=189 /DNA_ID=CAMNT_0006989627 /DNA_START=105 /DNA_END=674 /DNA_ORIENTATION=+